jgi:SAM-dependent methyltransferase
MALGERLSIVTPLHEATKRDVLSRMNDNKVDAMIVAKKYGSDYWDGDRRYGYGGYRFMPGRWKSVAQFLIERYGLNSSSSILDVGCGKGFLLYELQLLLPDARLVGFDVSDYGLKSKHPDFSGTVFSHRAQDPYPFRDQEFDLVVSLGVLHNLRLPELAIAIPEIERVAKSKYVMTESYRNEEEMFNLECWALTAESLLDDGEWQWLLELNGYTGDFELIYF